MKKFIAVCLVTSMIFTLAACSSKDNGSNERNNKKVSRETNVTVDESNSNEQVLGGPEATDKVEITPAVIDTRLGFDNFGFYYDETRITMGVTTYGELVAAGNILKESDSSKDVNEVITKNSTMIYANLNGDIVNLRFSAPREGECLAGEFVLTKVDYSSYGAPSHVNFDFQVYELTPDILKELAGKPDAYDISWDCTDETYTYNAKDGEKSIKIKFVNSEIKNMTFECSI